MQTFICSRRKKQGYIIIISKQCTPKSNKYNNHHQNYKTPNNTLD